MTVPHTLHGGRIEIEDNLGRKMLVPESTIVGEDCNIDRDTRFGQMCVVGDGVELKSALGNNVTIGNNSVVRAKLIGNNVTIGDGVSIQHEVIVRPGVIIPDNWLIPQGCIVNPGIDGFPVVITPASTFKCNVNGQISTGSRGW